MAIELAPQRAGCRVEHPDSPNAPPVTSIEPSAENAAAVVDTSRSIGATWAGAGGDSVRGSEPSAATLHASPPSTLEATASTRASCAFSMIAGALLRPFHTASWPSARPAATVDDWLSAVTLVMLAGKVIVAATATEMAGACPFAAATTHPAAMPADMSAVVRVIDRPSRASVRIPPTPAGRPVAR